jgi:hypothetical protein
MSILLGDRPKGNELVGKTHQLVNFFSFFCLFFLLLFLLRQAHVKPKGLDALDKT